MLHWLVISFMVVVGGVLIYGLCTGKQITTRSNALGGAGGFGGDSSSCGPGDSGGGCGDGGGGGGG
jgi:hypothetical protein